MLAAVFLAACGTGGGGSSSSSLGQEPSVGAVQSATGATPPVETAAEQDTRSSGILSRADSVLSSGGYGEPSDGGRTVRGQSSCSGTICSIREDFYGIRGTFSLSDLTFDTAAGEPVGTKHDVTLLRLTGAHPSFPGSDASFSALGAWMDHSGFLVQEDRGTPIGGVPANLRWSIAGGDLTRSRPLGNATWRGLMVGTPAGGSGKGQRLQGDATLTYDLDSATLDAAFTSIRNVDRLQPHSVSAVRFDDINVSNGGTFQAGSLDNQIQGGFYGPDHAETTGVFEKSNIIGAFGAKKQ